MSENVSYFKVGLFVAFGLALLVGAVIILGAGLFSGKGVMMETYLDESVQGLDLGAPIKYRGVQLGTVSQLGFVNNFYDIPIDDPRFAELGRYVVVRGKLDFKAAPTPESVDRLVAQGLRVRLATQGLTGTAYLELDYVNPAKNPPLAITMWTPWYPYLPSAPSTISKLGTAAERVFDRLDQLNIEGVVNNVNGTLERVQKSIDDAKIQALASEATALIVDLRKTSAEARGLVHELGEGGLAAHLNALLERLSTTVAGANGLLDDERGELASVIAGLRETTENLSEVSRTARSYPSFLFFGAPPPRVEPGAGR